MHLLPFFEPFDGADAGFDPVDHLTVDPRLGTWDDVAALAERFDVTADVIVNHVSADSPQFADVLERGAASPHDGMFLTLGGVFGGGATEADLLRIYRPRPGLPFTPVTVGGERRLAWTTFTPAQMDLDVADPATTAYHDAILDRMAASGVRMLRLDAVGYAVKTAGTSCFMTPETFAFIDSLTERAHARGLEVLVEIHSHYALQVEVGDRVDRVYDFALPPLVLHALIAADAAPLRRWLEIRPANAITVLDTHDGIGVIDVAADGASPELAGLLDTHQIDALVEAIHANSGGASRLATGAAASNVDLYQVNCTYYDALGRDNLRYLLARALQLFVPGIPQIYYVGLLAGENDVERLERTGVGRDINRHAYSEAEVAAALERPVVQCLLDLIRLRNEHPAFDGSFTHAEPEPGVLELAWRAGPRQAVLRARLAEGTYELDCS
ncbi:MAG: GH13_18 / GH13_4 / GH13 [uncultured Solirubrobacteraceae bacterium]|uniref:GH13_18 / GH13_4 / GH13 n=1 Tax=uncultured Solirubrobacteraceae bacterium TaxID=1162706 RepID=A0A6J4U0Q0_9ACTN|nr:MAG: GH13_18 / GH13_4 / GH13 [uncultured Solirubrobacteraceae bacterium]